MAKFLISILLLISSTSWATVSASNGMKRWRAQGYYGLASVNPSDINGNPVFNSVTPKPGNLTTDFYFGGGVGYMLSPKLDVRVIYESQNSKNATNLTNPAVSNGGFELIQNEIWGQINYYVVRNSRLNVYVGGGLGYPTYSHATLTLASATGYDADKSLNYIGQGGIDILLGNHFSLNFQGGYQSISMSNLKTSSGAVLTSTSGGNAKMDLSGARVQVGLAIIF